MAMNDRIQPGTYFQYSPSGIQSSPYNTMRPSTASMDRDGNRYLAELLAERQKLGPFMQVLPLCSRLLNQEIVRASGLASNQGFGDERFEHGSPLRSGGLLSNGAPMDLEGWSGMQTEWSAFSILRWHSAGIAGIPHLLPPSRLCLLLFFFSFHALNLF
ncbi:unnamed protein product [Victoria cruziana]